VNFNDADFAPPEPQSTKNWSYDTPQVLRLMILKYADETRAQQLISEADAEVAQKRAELGGRKLTPADFEGTKWTRNRWGAEEWALRYVLKLQTI
jgi:hypothetical protein